MERTKSRRTKPRTMSGTSISTGPNAMSRRSRPCSSTMSSSTADNEAARTGGPPESSLSKRNIRNGKIKISA